MSKSRRESFPVEGEVDDVIANLLSGVEDGSDFSAFSSGSEEEETSLDSSGDFSSDYEESETSLDVDAIEASSLFLENPEDLDAFIFSDYEESEASLDSSGDFSSEKTSLGVVSSNDKSDALIGNDKWRRQEKSRRSRDNLISP